MTKSVLLGGARTPIGKLNGALASKTAVEPRTESRSQPPLNARASLRIRSITSSWGRCFRAASGQFPRARPRSRLESRTPPPPRPSTASAVPACARSSWPICKFAPVITQVIVAGGMESMTNAPYLAAECARRLSMGDGVFEDMMQTDGLFSAIDQRTWDSMAIRSRARKS